MGVVAETICSIGSSEWQADMQPQLGIRVREPDPAQAGGGGGMNLPAWGREGRMLVGGKVGEGTGRR